MDNELLVKSIREMCKLNNITPSQLESELNFGAGIISRWTKSCPSLDKIVTIADYFNVSIDELIGRNIEEKSSKYDFIDSLIDLTDIDVIKWSEVRNYSKLEEVVYLLMLSEYKKCYKTTYNDSNIFLLKCENKSGKVRKIFKNYYFLIQPGENSSLILQKDITQERLETFWEYIDENCSMTPDEKQSNKVKEEIINKAKELKLNNSNIQPNIDSIKENKEILNKLNTPEMKKLISVFSDPKMNETIKSVQSLIALYNKNN